MNTPEPEPLDTWLRSSQHPRIPDDGFTARVLAALPPPQPARPVPTTDWTRFAAILIGTAAGILAAARHGIRASAAVESVARVLSAFSDPETQLACYVTIACLVVIYAPRLRRFWT